MKARQQIALTVLVLLVSMIFMRLVWMQLRDYRVGISTIALEDITAFSEHQDNCKLLELGDLSGGQVRGFPSAIYALAAGACLFDVFELKQLRKLNQWLWSFTVSFLILSARIMTGSWLIASLAGVVLMSRGSIMSHLGTAGEDFFVMFFQSIWMVCSCHYIRSLYRPILIIGHVAAGIAAWFNPIGLAFLLVWPLFSFVMLILKAIFRESIHSNLRLLAQTRRLQAKIMDNKPSVVSKSPHPMRPSPSPFLMHFKSFQDYKPVLFMPLAILACSVLLYGLLIYPVGQFGEWNFETSVRLQGIREIWQRGLEYASLNMSRADTHFWISIGVICTGALMGPRGLRDYFSYSWFVVTLVLVLSAVADLFPGPSQIGYRYEQGQKLDFNLLLWLEPLVICIGITSLYNHFRLLRFRTREF